jgi:PAS domain S-box-containing protein
MKQQNDRPIRFLPVLLTGAACVAIPGTYLIAAGMLHFQSGSAGAFYWAVSATAAALFMALVFALVRMLHSRERLLADQRRALDDLEQLRRLADATDTGLCIADPGLPEIPLTYVNNGFERLTGYPAAEALGRSCRFLQGPDTDQATVARIRRALQTGAPVRELLLNRRKDGTPFWNELRIDPVRDAAGNVVQFVGIQTDVTARERARELLAGEARVLAGFARGGPIEEMLGALCDWVDGLIPDASCNVYAYDRAAGSLRPMSGRLTTRLGDVPLPAGDAADPDKTAEALRQTIPEYGRIWAVPCVQSPDVLLGALAILAAAPRPQTEEEARILATAANLAALALERDAHDRSRALAQRMETVGRLASGISHDFNNMLGIVLGNLELLENAAMAPQAKVRIEAALRATARASLLARELLAFSKRRPRARGQVRLKLLLPAIAAMVQSTLPARVKLTISHSPDAPDPFCDESGLEHALVNLIANARDAIGPAAGAIALTARTAPAPAGGAGPWVEILVADDGPGMTRETAARAFDPFFSTKAAGGTGLGLSMVRDFAVASGGQATIETAPGGGTRVHLLLPSAGAEAAADGGPALPGRAPADILLVEDEADLRASTQALLERLGHRVTAVGDPSAARAQLAAARYEILVADNDLGGEIDGAQLVASALADDPAMRAILVSAHHDKLAALAPTARLTLLEKPAGSREFAAALAKCR